MSNKFNFDLQFFLHPTLQLLSPSLSLSHSSVNSIAFVRASYCTTTVLVDNFVCVCCRVAWLKVHFFLCCCKKVASDCCCLLLLIAVASCRLQVASCQLHHVAQKLLPCWSRGRAPSWCSCHKPLNPLMDSLHNSHKWGWTQELDSRRGSARGGTPCCCCCCRCCCCCSVYTTFWSNRKICY